jgi:hypothetical protein
VLRRTRFDAREADFYEALYTQSRASFGAYVQAGTLLNNYAHIFDLVGDCVAEAGGVAQGGASASLMCVVPLRQAVDQGLVVHSMARRRRFLHLCSDGY